MKSEWMHSWGWQMGTRAVASLGVPVMWPSPLSSVINVNIHLITYSSKYRNLTKYFLFLFHFNCQILPIQMIGFFMKACKLRCQATEVTTQSKIIHASFGHSEWREALSIYLHYRIRIFLTCLYLARLMSKRHCQLEILRTKDQCTTTWTGYQAVAWSAEKVCNVRAIWVIIWQLFKIPRLEGSYGHKV